MQALDYWASPTVEFRDALNADFDEVLIILSKGKEVIELRDGTARPPHAFAARYYFSAEISKHLADAKPGFGGEIQLTDAMQKIASAGSLTGVPVLGKRLDIGSPDGLIDAALFLRG